MNRSKKNTRRGGNPAKKRLELMQDLDNNPDKYNNLTLLCRKHAVSIEFVTVLIKRGLVMKGLNGKYTLLTRTVTPLFVEALIKWENEHREETKRLPNPCEGIVIVTIEPEPFYKGILKLLKKVVKWK